MNKAILTLYLSTLTTFCLAQSEKVGLFKSLNVKSGLTITYFHNFQGERVYILQQNASVVERSENKNGATLSVVILFPFDDNSMFNLLLNVPLVDYKSTAADINLFNSQTPFGVGFALFPFNKPNFFGFTTMVNIGRQNRMRDDAIKTQFFPIADYPNYKLAVGSPVPEAILESKSSLYKETTLAVNVGIIIRL